VRSLQWPFSSAHSPTRLRICLAPLCQSPHHQPPSVCSSQRPSYGYHLSGLGAIVTRTQPSTLPHLSNRTTLPIHNPSSLPCMEPHKQLMLTNYTLFTVTKKLGCPQLQDWQVSLTRDILNGKDVVFMGGTGCGKTTLLYAPLLAFHLDNPMAVGLSITLMKALGRDQVCRSPCPSAGLLRLCKEHSALLKGIPAVAIDEDTASHASLNEH
jgi:hypothetical protein